MCPRKAPDCQQDRNRGSVTRAQAGEAHKYTSWYIIYYDLDITRRPAHQWHPHAQRHWLRHRTSRSKRIGVGGKTNEPVPMGLHPSSTRSSARMRLAMLAVCL